MSEPSKGSSSRCFGVEIFSKKNFKNFFKNFLKFFSTSERSLRPRAKLKRPEFYDQDSPKAESSAGKEKKLSKRAKKSAILDDEQPTTTTRAKKRASLESKEAASSS